MNTTIKLFTVKYKGDYIQIEGISDIYTRVCLDTNKFGEKGELCPELYKMNQGEAKDLCGKFGDFEVEIIDKKIELA